MTNVLKAILIGMALTFSQVSVSASPPSLRSCVDNGRLILREQPSCNFVDKQSVSREACLNAKITASLDCIKAVRADGFSSKKNFDCLTSVRQAGEICTTSEFCQALGSECRRTGNCRQYETKCVKEVCHDRCRDICSGKEISCEKSGRSSCAREVAAASDNACHIK